MGKDDKNDKIVITEGYLRNFADKNLQGFLDTRGNPAVTDVLQYVPLTETDVPSGATDVYAVVRPGNPQVLQEVGILRTAHDTFSKNLQSAVRELYRITLNMQDDLLDVDQILIRGEDDAALTAEEMVTVLNDIWKPLAVVDVDSEFPGLGGDENEDEDKDGKDGKK